MGSGGGGWTGWLGLGGSVMARLCVWLGYVYGSADGSARWMARLGGWLGLVDGSAR